MLRKLLLLIAAAAGPVWAGLCQAPQSWTSAEIYQGIRKLNVLGSVLYVAAHPDDENTRLITYFSKDRLYRTGYLSITRGDGGQNLIGEEQGIELGLIRTQELLAARRIDGGEQFFTRAFDFGYSKSPEETFTKWDKEKILSDVVWVIRKFRPDVIITRFPTTGEGGHGHHTASAILANEAFIAAADPSRFPGQLKYVQAWQPKRIVWNTFNFGAANTTSSDQFKFDVGGYNALLGKSYGEIAAASRSQHKSQGFGVASGRGEAFEFFRIMSGSPPVNDLFDGVDLTWGRVKDGGAIAKIVDSLTRAFDFLNPERSVKGLVRLHRALAGMPASYWRDQKLSETTELILQSSGLFLDATSSEAIAVQTDSIRFAFSFNNRLGSNSRLLKLSVNGFDSTLNVPLVRNRNLNFARAFFVSPTQAITQPYWLASRMEEGYFNVGDQQKIGQPDVDPAYTTRILLSVEGLEFWVEIPVRHRFTDPVNGEMYQPLVVVPPALIAPDEPIKISKGNNEFGGSLTITGKKKSFATRVEQPGVEQPDEFSVTYSAQELQFPERNRSQTVQYLVKAGRDNEYHFALDAGTGRKDYLHVGLNEIRYDHIPYIRYFTPATVVNRKLDLQTYGKRIGYIVGAGDKVPGALEQMGYEVTTLSSRELARNDLSKFDAIITGVRAYNTNEWMNNYYDKLMRYVQEGGNLIVQYNTSSNLGPVRARIGPYDFNISRNRITDERSPVSILKPEHPALSFPNRITEQDFEGWVQERSIYHASNWGTNFESVLALNDPGEKPDEGSLIIAKYGKGYFTYTGLAFFRQLPAGVPGAYRLLANLIALNRKKAF
ncbi:MAG TPA: PIG-L family deacetylase [Chitinophagaceae bacterium]|nr:PIG-L family deacetylase [Chitinophagaceae bacterium]